MSGKWSDKYIYENYFFYYLNAQEHSGAIIAHLPRGVNHILNGYRYTWMALKNSPSPGPRNTTSSKFFHRILHFSKIITPVLLVKHPFSSFCLVRTCVPM